MSRAVVIRNKEEVKNGIIAIGQELIKRAEDISTDIERVSTITIYAVLNPSEVVNFDITKNYKAFLEEETEEVEK